MSDLGGTTRSVRMHLPTTAIPSLTPRITPAWDLSQREQPAGSLASRSRDSLATCSPARAVLANMALYRVGWIMFRIRMGSIYLSSASNSLGLAWSSTATQADAKALWLSTP